jgi:mRNA-degrading endonuclease RelE of RelBE toxin-antitoxin system
MRYTVSWTPTAEQDLAGLWLRATDRETVRSAADTLDRLLREDAHLRGESRYDSLRIVHAAPLGVDIEVDQENRAVWVLKVWRYGKS